MKNPDNVERKYTSYASNELLAIGFALLMSLLAFGISIYFSGPYSCPQRVTEQRLGYFHSQVQSRIDQGTWTGDITSLENFPSGQRYPRDHHDGWDRPFIVAGGVIRSLGKDGAPGGKGLDADLATDAQGRVRPEPKTLRQKILHTESYTPWLVLVSGILAFTIFHTPQKHADRDIIRLSSSQIIAYFFAILLVTGVLAICESVASTVTCVPTH